MTYTVLNGQTIFDIALNTYGDPSYVYQLIQDNPSLVNIDTSPSPGISITWNPLLIKNLPAPIASTQANTPITVGSYISRAGQNIYDICLQVYGDLSYLYKLIQDNSLSNIQSNILPGTLFNFNPTLTKNTLFSSWLNKNNIILGTDSNPFKVYSNETQTVIYTSEDGSVIYTPE